jgi:hypothetical protein
VSPQLADGNAALCRSGPLTDENGARDFNIASIADQEQPRSVKLLEEMAAEVG